jgi:hypothetical protein
VHRAEHHVEGARVEEGGDLVAAADQPVHLDPQQHRHARIAGGQDRLAVRVDVLGGLLAPPGIVVPVARLGEAVDVLGHGDLGNSPRPRPLRIAADPDRRQVPAVGLPGGRRRGPRAGAVRLEVHVVVGQHGRGD